MTPTDPHTWVMRLALGHVASRAVYALAHFRIADHMTGGALGVAELARATSTHAASLHRLLRAATALDLLTEEDDGRFALTPAGAALRSDAPRHAASAVLTGGTSAMWRSFGEFLHSVQTGEPPLARMGGAAFGEMPPESASYVSETMDAFYGTEPAAVVEAYDFAGIGTLADIGGGSGNLLSTVLQAYPSMQGVHFDLPHAIPHATRTLHARGVAGRCRLIGGNFFDRVPPGADAYFLSHVLNDWPEERCLAILGSIRRAIPARGRLLVIEQVVTPGRDADQAKMLDLISLVATGGRHRSIGEHTELLARGGFRMKRVVATREPASVMEAEPA